MFDAGALQQNRIPYDPGLVERFSEYFKAVAQDGDWCQPAPPFFHLRSGGFWKHKPLFGREAEYAALDTSGGGSKRILDNIDYAYLDEDAFAVVANPQERQALRQFILKTFFSVDDQQKLQKVIEQQARISDYESMLEGLTEKVEAAPPADTQTRSVAFSRVIRRIYDYQCAMCGLRIIGPDGSTPIDAAHLIPWRESYDDSPTNGVALCKLHHWALDASLVSPTLDLKWIVSTWLDRRRNSERELTRFHRSSILLPREHEHYPRHDAILWRLNRLVK
jgi:putative restriction endonuclease